MSKTGRPLPFGLLMALLAVLAVFSALLGLRYGSVSLSFFEVFRGLMHLSSQEPVPQILRVVRLPHVAACALSGMGLSVSGVLLQSAADNPLAGPSVIGVNAGAGFAMVLMLCLFPMAYRFLPLAAFLGAFACTLLIVAAGSRAGGSRLVLVLSGVAVSALLNAGISLFKLLYPEMSLAYNAFSVGGFSGVTFDALVLPALMILLVFLCAMLFSSRLNLLCLGDSLARSLGVRARLLRCFSFLLSSASAAAAVSFSGLLGFVGLMVPHMARKITGCEDLKKLLPASALLGAILVICSDLLGRVLFAPSEIPAGMITAFLGAPFFFFLLLKRRER